MHLFLINNIWYPNRKNLTDELSVLIVGWWPVSLDGNVSCPGRAGGDGPKNPHS